ncbi:MAG: M48 family metallopeptidase [Pseudorhodoplanes sp.]
MSDPAANAPSSAASHAAWVATLPKTDARAVYYDGKTSRKHQVALRFGSALEMIEDGETIAAWAYADIRRADSLPGILRLRAVGALPLARLEIADVPTQSAVVARCALLDSESGSARQIRRIVFWSVAAICSIVLTAVYGVPLIADRLALLIPYGVEKRIGEAVEPQLRAVFGGKVCNNAPGQAAFAALIDKLVAAGDIRAPVRAQVISSAVPNAFALPGGSVYLFDGLLQKAQSPDEIVGVLAHELGHVHHRDSLRVVIQNGGTSFLIGLLFGDITGAGAVIFAGRTLLNASYSREAEQNADDFAVTTMRNLGRSATPMGQLLVRITGKEMGGAATLLSSHPLSADRLARMKQADRPATGPDLLSAAEWAALKAICKGN